MRRRKKVFSLGGYALATITVGINCQGIRPIVAKNKGNFEETELGATCITVHMRKKFSLR